MKIREGLAKLEADPSFQNWKNEYPDAYLANVFAMIDFGGKVIDWQYGFYNPSDEMLTPFTTGLSKVEMGQPDKVFKEPGQDVLALDKEKEFIGAMEAMDKAKEIGNEKHPEVLVNMILCILQNKDGKNIYNITLIGTHAVTVNVKMDASDGAILQTEKISLFDKLQK